MDSILTGPVMKLSCEQYDLYLIISEHAIEIFKVKMANSAKN